MSASSLNPLKGLSRYRDLRSGVVFDSLFELIGSRESRAFEIDEEFLQRYRNQRSTWPLTFVKGIERCEGSASVEFETPVSLHQAICFELQKAVDARKGSAPFALALSGGVDSQLLFLLCRELSIPVLAYSLRSRLSGYCEWREVEEFAEKFGVDVIPIDVVLEDFLVELPDFLAAVETPIYNLHAVSKWLLAKKLKALGVTAVISGDGADQVFARAIECDLFPITLKSFSSHGLELFTPLASHGLVDYLATRPLITKNDLQQLASTMGLEVASKKSSFLREPAPFAKPEDCLRLTLDLLRGLLKKRGFIECAGLPESIETMA